MKGSRFAWAFSIGSALFLVATLMTVGSAAAQDSSLVVNTWGQSEINEDGNLRFRVTASASGISWGDCCPEAVYLQLWAHVEGGPTTSPIDTWVLIKSKAAYNRYGQPTTSISGTSPRFRLPRGTYTYHLFVVVPDPDDVIAPPEDPTPYALAVSVEHLGGTVTLP